MDISEVSNKFKVCDIVINNNPYYRKLWDVIWVNECDNDILTQNNGRCYFIIVNGIIKKIGFSDQNGGIKSTINSYKNSGNSGRPSDRTHGIHVMIAEELLKGNKVEFYFTYNKNIEIEIELMDGTKKISKQSLSGKILENENMDIYKSKLGKYPDWNLQEAGKPWPKYLQESRINLFDGKPVTYEDIKLRLGI
jgi:hypothetical protein